MSGGAKIEILRLLNAGPTTGLSMIRASAKLSRFTIYHHLNALEDGGFVTSQVINEAGQRTYSITDAGRDALTKAKETK